MRLIRRSSCKEQLQTLWARPKKRSECSEDWNIHFGGSESTWRKQSTHTEFPFFQLCPEGGCSRHQRHRGSYSSLNPSGGTEGTRKRSQGSQDCSRAAGTCTEKTGPILCLNRSLLFESGQADCPRAQTHQHPLQQCKIILSPKHNVPGYNRNIYVQDKT